MLTDAVLLYCVARHDAERRSDVAHATHRLLKRIKRIPGTAADGKIDAEALFVWVSEVRRLCEEHSRPEIGDQKIGELLARAPSDEDGTWPCRQVCEVMERIAALHIERGFNVAVHNSRGAHWRGEGGAQERELAAKYRDWAAQRAFDYPYVGRVLEGIAADYDREGEWQDSEAKIRKRLRY